MSKDNNNSREPFAPADEGSHGRDEGKVLKIYGIPSKGSDAPALIVEFSSENAEAAQDFLTNLFNTIEGTESKPHPGFSPEGAKTLEAFFSFPEETQKELERKLEIVFKAAGIDGPEPGEEFDLSDIPENSGAAHAMATYGAVKHHILRYIRMGEPGTEDRVDHLLELAIKTESTLETLSKSPIRKKHSALIEKEQKSFKETPPQKRGKIHRDYFIGTGIDLNHPAKDQFKDQERRDLWKFGPEELTNNFDSIFSFIKERLDHLEQKYISPTQRNVISAQQKNLAQLQERARKRQEKQKNAPLHASSSESAPASSAQEDSQAKRREKLEALLNAEQAMLESLRGQIETEQAKIPGNKNLLSQQAELLEMAAEDFETGHSSALSRSEEKRNILSALAESGHDISKYETPDETENLLNKRLEDLISTKQTPGDQDRPSRISGDRDDSDLEGLEDVDPELHGRITNARAERDALEKTLFAAQAENASLTAATVRTEQSINKLLEATEKLKDAETALNIELTQLSYMLENAAAVTDMTHTFNKKAEYPPLSGIAAWAKSHLDENKIVIAPDALQRVAQSTHSNPEAIYGALETLSNRGQATYKGELKQRGLRERFFEASHKGRIPTLDIGGNRYNLNHWLEGKEESIHISFAPDHRENRVVVGDIALGRH